MDQESNIEIKQVSYDWVVRVIDSCTNQFQLEGGSTMIDHFKAWYDDELLTNQLKEFLQKKNFELHNILN